MDMYYMLAACIVEEGEKAPYAARRLPLMTGVGDAGSRVSLFTLIERRLGRWPRKEAERLRAAGRLCRRLPPPEGMRGRRQRGVARAGHLPGALGAPGRGSRGFRRAREGLLPGHSAHPGGGPRASAAVSSTHTAAPGRGSRELTSRAHPTGLLPKQGRAARPRGFLMKTDLTPLCCPIRTALSVVRQ